MTKFRIDEIEATQATQTRTSLDVGTIDAYAEDLKSGAVFPPIVCFSEEGSERYILADGFHRLQAHNKAGVEEIEVDLREGNIHDALLYALSCNAEHGLRRSRADKRRSVELALKDSVLSQKSLREIADICRVHHSTVAQIGDKLAVRQDRKRNKPHDQKPEKNGIDNVRQSRPAPTQADMDLVEIRTALGLIKGLPYSGMNSGHLAITSDDLDDMRLVNQWLAEALLEHDG